MLASRARRRVRSGSAEPDSDPRRQREIVDAFLAAAVAGRALLFSQPGASPEHALVNGAAGVVTRRNGKMVAVLGFTIAHDKIVAIDVLADPERLSRLDRVAG